MILLSLSLFNHGMGPWGDENARATDCAHGFRIVRHMSNSCSYGSISR